MKINILGRGHAYMLAEMLTDYGHIADNNSVNYDYYDVNLVMGLWDMPKPLPENTVVFCMGSDVWRDHLISPKVKLLLVPNIDMVPNVALTGQVWNQWRMPVNTNLFNLDVIHLVPKRDILFYALDPVTYRLDQILQEVNENPNKTYTLLGEAAPNFIMEIPHNLLCIQKVPYHLMPQMYMRHKNFKVSWSHPGSGAPAIMNYEAYLMGLASYWNGEPVIGVPDDMKSEEAIPRLLSLISKL